MGGRNAWQCAEAYPDAMDGIMPVVAFPTKVIRKQAESLDANDLLHTINSLSESMRDHVRSRPAYRPALDEPAATDRTGRGIPFRLCAPGNPARIAGIDRKNMIRVSRADIDPAIADARRFPATAGNPVEDSKAFSKAPSQREVFLDAA
jgi:hypothetical protein